MSLVIVNCGTGNPASVKNMLKKLGHDSQISDEAQVIRSATKLILPGVGAFDPAMVRLRKTGLIPLLEDKVLGEKTPILGICLGMQLLVEGSEEGKEPGLGWISGRAVRFDLNRSLWKVPHMGWNFVESSQGSALFAGFDSPPRFYFVHSYHVQVKDVRNAEGTTVYGCGFVSALRKENIYGVQFHPEKSHRYGMQLLKNFVEQV